MASDGYRPLPVAPRPFEGEVLGGWIGRIASRYKLSVNVFERTFELDLGLLGGRGWLLLDHLPSEALTKLSSLMRMNPHDICAIAVPPAAAGACKALWYCPRCVFVNAVDVTAPIWRSDWFDPKMTHCPTDGLAFRAIPSGAALACGNLDQLIAHVGLYERRLRDKAAEKLR